MIWLLWCKWGFRIGMFAEEKSLVSKFWNEKLFAIDWSFWNKIKLSSVKILSLEGSSNLNYFLQKFLINKWIFVQNSCSLSTPSTISLSIDNQNQKRSINNPASNPLIKKLLTAFQSPRLRCDLFWHEMLISLWQDKSKNSKAEAPRRLIRLLSIELLPPGKIVSIPSAAKVLAGFP